MERDFFEIVRPAQWRTVPWKNGGGHTAEIVSRGRPGAAGFDWRLSLATVEGAGPFSNYAGYDRTIVLVSGAGMDLQTHTNVCVRLLVALRPQN